MSVMPVQVCAIRAGSATGGSDQVLIIRWSWVRADRPLRSSQLKAPAAAVSRIEAHVLHANNFLAFVLGDGVPDGHVIGGQVQFVGAGQRVVARERIREGRDWLVQQMEDRALDRPPQRLRGGPRSPARTSPGKRTRRSLTYSPRLGELLAGERGRVIARAGISLNTRHGGASPDLPAQPLQLSFQRIQFGTGNAHQFGCFGTHVAPSFRRFQAQV